MNRTSVIAWERFRQQVTEQGGVVLEPSWLGKDKPHRLLCREGHECSPRPGDVRGGKGICRACAGLDPAAADRRFRELVAAQGGVVLEPVWLGVHAPHLVRCAAGHETRPAPSNVRNGQGICRVCAVRDPVTAERQFRERVTALGGTVADQVWRGVDASHAVICAEGHECTPRPSELKQGGGLCRSCAGNNPADAERSFRARVEALGGRVVEPKWLGNKVPHTVICAEGHEAAPRPNDVIQGEGICRRCAGRRWDVFYVVTSPRYHHLKFGITSGDPRPRLGAHATDGFTVVNLLLAGLPGTAAPDLETATLATLRMAGEPPVRGREYFDSSVLALVLDVAEDFERAQPGHAAIVTGANRTVKAYSPGTGSPPPATGQPGSLPGTGPGTRHRLHPPGVPETAQTHQPREEPARCPSRPWHPGGRLANGG